MFNRLTELRNKMEKIEGIVINASDQVFEAMTYKDKINFVANLIVELNNKRQDKVDKLKLE